MLSFQKLDVYQRAIDFLALTADIAADVPRGNAALLDQLRRAATSIPLNIAEVAGRTGEADAARTYAIARGSAMECAAALDALLSPCRRRSPSARRRAAGTHCRDADQALPLSSPTATSPSPSPSRSTTTSTITSTATWCCPTSAPARRSAEHRGARRARTASGAAMTQPIKTSAPRY